tara:strand:+ start:2692 stop:3528 length:837 start_codon:yes stop_codon:yes gene_type:complete
LKKLIILLIFIPLFSLSQTLYQTEKRTDIDYKDNVFYLDKKDFLDIYIPKGKKNYPVVVYFHGGALIAGSKEMGKDVGEKLAKNGIGFVSANYRLSPTVKYPSHINDAQAATEWVFNNIESLGGDLKNVYVSGHSAGAYLAAILALNKELRIHKMKKIKGAILISPFLYVEETAPVRIKRDTIYKSIWGTNQKDWEKASVSPYVEGNNENFISIMAENDEAWRKDQNKRFITKLNEKQIAGYVEIPNRNHVSLISKILEKDDQLTTTIIEFIQRNLID